MQKAPPVVLFILVLLFIAMSCDKSSSGNGSPRQPADTSAEETPPPDAPPSAGTAPYSGRWSGTIAVTDVNPNLCAYPDKQLETAQSWTVRGDSVQVEELIVVNSERKTYYWRGTIRNDTLQMESRRYERCAGVSLLRQLKLKASLKVVAGTYSLEGFTVYNICEPNCIFEYAYNMRKE